MKLSHLSLFAACLAFIRVGAIGQTTDLHLVNDESKVTYTLIHPLHEIEATSKDVMYVVETDPAIKDIKRVTAQVDVTTFDSGNSNRDSHAMEVIDALTYPEATFASTSITQTGDSIHVTGKLTFHGVTKQIVLAGLSTWLDHKLLIHGGFDISLTEFNIERPSLLMIPVDDTLKFKVVAAFVWK